MKALISTVLKTDEDKMWDELQKVSSLMYVASPLLRFKPQKGQSLPDKWRLGTEYKLKLYFGGLSSLFC